MDEKCLDLKQQNKRVSLSDYLFGLEFGLDYLSECVFGRKGVAHGSNFQREITLTLWHSKALILASGEIIL